MAAGLRQSEPGLAEIDVPEDAVDLEGAGCVPSCFVAGHGALSAPLWRDVCGIGTARHRQDVDELRGATRDSAAEDDVERGPRGGCRTEAQGSGSPAADVPVAGHEKCPPARISAGREAFFGGAEGIRTQSR